MKRSKKVTNLIAIISILIGISIVVYIEYDPNRAEVHRHKAGYMHYPNFKKAPILICGDTAFVRFDRHIEIHEWSRRWISDTKNNPMFGEE